MTGVAVQGTVVFGLTMTFHTPAHCQIGVLIDLFHILNRPVTGLAFESVTNVPLMIEVDKVRKHMNLFPLDRFVVDIGLCQFGDVFAVAVSGAVHLDMTIDTDIHTRNGRMPGNFYLSMAVLAVDTQFPGVQAVLERNGLFRGISFIISNVLESSDGGEDYENG